MAAKPYRPVVLLFAVIFLVAVHVRAVGQASNPSLPRVHRHIGVDKSATGTDIPEFAMTEVSLEASTKKESLITNRARTHDAFTVERTRLFIAERSTGRVFEIRGLQLEWRPFSELTWANDHTLMFDRWSQPHYGVHYSVEVKEKRLTAAVPFPDKFFLAQQKPKSKSKSLR